MAFREVSERLDSLRAECVEFLSQICSIPALGPENQGSGEMEKYKVVRDAVLALKPDHVERSTCA